MSGRSFEGFNAFDQSAAVMPGEVPPNDLGTIIVLKDDSRRLSLLEESYMQAYKRAQAGLR